MKLFGHDDDAHGIPAAMRETERLKMKAMREIERLKMEAR
jgi:hypothetical protein